MTHRLFNRTMALIGEFLESVTVKLTIFQDLTPSYLLNLNSFFRDPSAFTELWKVSRTCCLHLQESTDQERRSLLWSISTHLPTTLHGVTSQMMAIIKTITNVIPHSTFCQLTADMELMVDTCSNSLLQSKNHHM